MTNKNLQISGNFFKIVGIHKLSQFTLIVSAFLFSGLSNLEQFLFIVQLLI